MIRALPFFLHYLSAQTAFYSLNPDRDILGPLASHFTIFTEERLSTEIMQPLVQAFRLR
jgi:hypothetical protein